LHLPGAGKQLPFGQDVERTAARLADGAPLIFANPDPR
jgi:hypothetical protein